MLTASGWQVQARARMNRTAADGVAVCEFPLTTGKVDYLLFAQGKPIGVVEVKPAGQSACPACTERSRGELIEGIYVSCLSLVSDV